VTDALTAFNLARLDDEERDAQAATLGPWVAESDGRPGGGLVITGRLRSQYGEPVSVACGPNAESVLLNEDATHIARQDPPATLTRVAALRALVEAHAPVPMILIEADDEAVTCPADNVPLYNRVLDPNPQLMCPICEVLGCDVALGIAAIWRHHSGYAAAVRAEG